MGPFKCPDCGVWWAGYVHQCAPPINVPNTTWPVTIGHCHGCSSFICNRPDDVPCMMHQAGYTTTTTWTVNNCMC